MKHGNSDFEARSSLALMKKTGLMVAECLLLLPLSKIEYYGNSEPT